MKHFLRKMKSKSKIKIFISIIFLNVKTTFIKNTTVKILKNNTLTNIKSSHFFQQRKQSESILFNFYAF